MRLVAGIDQLDIPSLFAASQRRIILHAAVYGAFAQSEAHLTGLKTALSRKHFHKLDIIALDPNHTLSWTRPFLNALRFGRPSYATDREVTQSYRLMRDFAGLYPDKITLHITQQLPCLPIIIADDTLIFGQYAHAEDSAPQGFWGQIQTNVAQLMHWAEQEDIPSHATDEEIAALRLVHECLRNMNAHNATKFSIFKDSGLEQTKKTKP